MNPAIDTALLERGIEGIVILLLVYACQRLWKEKNDAQEARINDLNLWRKEHLELTTQMISALTVNSRASDAQVHANEAVQETLKEFGDELRKRR